MAILFDAVSKCLRYKKIRVAIFRRTYPELEKSIIFNFLNKVPNTLYEYNKQEKRATFHDTGSVIEFDHCQFEQDVFKFQSAEYDFIYIDELTHWTEWMYLYLLSRLRTTRMDFKVQMKCASNPGGVGHEFVRKRFISDAFPTIVTSRTDEQTHSTYTTQFIPAKVYDNEYLMRTDYIKGLMRLPEDDRKALLEGDWDSFKGQYFKEWRRALHVIQPFEIPKEWMRFRSMDWGYRNPTAILWFAVSPQRKVYIYKEAYVTEQTDEQVAKLIKEYSKDELISYTVADPSLWSINQYERGESIAMRMANFGVPLVKGDNNRLSGWSVMRSYFEVEPDGKPGMMIFENCFNFIRTVPAMVYDDRKPEDINTEGEDHMADACRYGLMSHPIPRKGPHPKPPALSFDWVIGELKHERELRSYVGRS